MSIWREEIGKETWLVGVSGRLDHLQTPELESELLEIAGSGDRKMIIDMSEVTYVNSGGLRCLVTIWRKAQRGSGIVVLSGINPTLMDLFTTVGFHKVFDIYPTTAEAKQALEVS
jgi:anti-sigma B factor antagonist